VRRKKGRSVRREVGLWAFACIAHLADIAAAPLRCVVLALASGSRLWRFPRKEVIQPQLPLQLPCYDFVPVTRPAFGQRFLAVRYCTSGVTSSHDVTGGVYKARERIHRSVLTCGY
jgi:hypothetical protein